MKYIETLTGEKAALEVVECDCGFHLGIDGSYLVQVGDVQIKCPVCERMIDTAQIQELGTEEA